MEFQISWAVRIVIPRIVYRMCISELFFYSDVWDKIVGVSLPVQSCLRQSFWIKLQIKLFKNSQLW